MSSATRRILAKRTLAVSLLFLLFLGLVASRRWQQLASPQVWAEDGRFIDGFLNRGWREFLHPVNGYLILVPKILTWASLSVSIYHYPILSTVLACLFSAGVGLAVAFAPTRLLGKILCAVSVFLVPSNSEVFGLPLFALWWAPVLLLLLAVWDERRPLPGLRMLFLVLGGLSSPFVIFVLPVFYFRAFFLKGARAEKIMAIAGTAVAAVQLYFATRAPSAAASPVSSFLKHVVPRFCGWFVGGNFSDNLLVLWPLGLLLLALIATFLYRGRRDPFAWILVYLYFAAVAASTLRVDPAILHPVGAGPRYFFFPYLLAFWILIQLAMAAGGGWLRPAAIVLILAAALNAVPQWSRGHDDLQWSQHLVSARQFSEYTIPIESDGRRSRPWGIRERGGVWDAAVRADWLLSPEELAELPTFAYQAFRTGGGGEPSAPGPLNGVDFADGGSTISYGVAGTRKEVDLRLHAGGRIRYRSGPAGDRPSMEIVGHAKEFLPDLPITDDWVTLEFSNAGLPPEFTVRVTDQGHGVGEWSATGGQN